MNARLLLVLLCLGLPACATPRTAAERPQFSDPEIQRAMREEHEAKPVRLRCELFYRETNELGPGDTGNEPKFQHVSRVLDLGPEQGGEVTLGKVTLGAQYSDSPYEGASFRVSVRSENRPLHATLYQFSRAHPPSHEFAGDHGFSGLVYVSAPNDPRGDYQYICKVPRDAPR